MHKYADKCTCIYIYINYIYIYKLYIYNIYIYIYIDIYVGIYVYMRCMDTYIDRQIDSHIQWNFGIFHVSFWRLYAFTRIFKISFVSQSLPCTFPLLPNSERRGTSYLKSLMFRLDKFERNISNKQGFTVWGICFQYSEKCSGLLAELVRIYSPLSLYVLAV